MAQREWVEKDFYKELGVSSDAAPEEIKRAARKLLAENHPDRNPGNKSAEDRYKAVSEAKEVLTDPAKRKEYDETRRLFAGGGFGAAASTRVASAASQGGPHMAPMAPS
ncbi:dnaJ domain protein [Mycobacterium ulcerans str. Harvey]|uniref:DnaJ domain protein n=1 Tax=Mycobacterium ulcerans str. Harvey TaxID=1299332 RepID=A0ABP3AN32_MYCUL|nr:dnaJ domain protein [Mycobacterium ulcerans str. Harvey]